MVCTADPCFTAGTCDPGTGLCSDPVALPDTAPCDDGDACTLGDACVGSACVGVIGEAVDQSNYVSGGFTTVWWGQTFTVGFDGVLRGIEVKLRICKPTPTGERIALHLFDAAGALLTTAYIDPSTQPLTCDFNSLPLTRGQHYFDVSDLCLPVTAGEVLRFEVDLLAVGETECIDGQCVPGPVGQSCFSDSQCAYVDGIAASSSNGYPGGTLIDPSGVPYPDGDMHFRSYVDPFVPASP